MPVDKMSDRPKRKRGQAIKDDMKLVVDEALAPIKQEIAKLPQIDSINALLSNLTASLKAEFDNQLESHNDKIAALEKKLTCWRGSCV